MRRALALLAACAVLAGCAAGAPTGPTPQPSLAPPVPQPRPLGDVPACDVLTEAQKLDLGIDLASEKNTIEGDPYGCQWRNPTETATLGLTVRLPPIGLESLYTLREVYEVFEPGEIDGFPVVVAGPDLPGDDYCRLYIGVAPDQMVDTRVAGVSPGQGCAFARRMAEAVIANLPPP